MNPCRRNGKLFPHQSSLDCFNRLPDEIVLSIFNKLHDLKALCLSMCVCKRFRSVASQVEEIFLLIPIKNALGQESVQETQMNNLILMKPLHLFSHLLKFASENMDIDSDLMSDSMSEFHFPDEILNPFAKIRSLRCKLWSERGNTNSRVFGKWKADFDRELKSFVMLVACSVTEKAQIEEKPSVIENEFIEDDAFKSRTWMMVSFIVLVSASKMHFLTQIFLKKHKMIENVVVCDENEDGWVCMNKGQIEELRESMEKDDDGGGNLSKNQRTTPALRMKIWYLRKLELPDSGKVMEEVTLVLVRPVAGGGDVAMGQSDVDLVAESFAGENVDGKMIEEAARKLMVGKECRNLVLKTFPF